MLKKILTLFLIVCFIICTLGFNTVTADAASTTSGGDYSSNTISGIGGGAVSNWGGGDVAPSKPSTDKEDTPATEVTPTEIKYYGIIMEKAISLDKLLLKIENADGTTNVYICSNIITVNGISYNTNYEEILSELQNNISVGAFAKFKLKNSEITELEFDYTELAHIAYFTENDGSDHTVKAVAVNSKPIHTIIISGYEGGILKDCKITKCYGQQIVSAALSGDFDEIKIVAVGNIANLKPLCKEKVLLINSTANTKP